MILSLIKLNKLNAASPESLAKCIFFDEGDQSDVDDDTDGKNDPVPTQAQACVKIKTLGKTSHFLLNLTCELGVVVAGDGVDVSDQDDCLNPIHLLHIVDEISCLPVITLQAAFVDQYVEPT